MRICLCCLDTIRGLLFIIFEFVFSFLSRYAHTHFIINMKSKYLLCIFRSRFVFLSLLFSLPVYLFLLWDLFHIFFSCCVFLCMSVPPTVRRYTHSTMTSRCSLSDLFYPNHSPPHKYTFVLTFWTNTDCCCLAPTHLLIHLHSRNVPTFYVEALVPYKSKPNFTLSLVFLDIPSYWIDGKMDIYVRRVEDDAFNSDDRIHVNLLVRSRRRRRKNINSRRITQTAWETRTDQIVVSSITLNFEMHRMHSGCCLMTTVLLKFFLKSISFIENEMWIKSAISMADWLGHLKCVCLFAFVCLFNLLSMATLYDHSKMKLISWFNLPTFFDSATNKSSRN